MTTNKDVYILLHGAWHAGWCWRYVVSALNSKGHTALAPDLPGHGTNLMPFVDIHLQTYVDYVIQKIKIFPEPVILVGHSMAGTTISQVAEIIPERIKRLVYISAFMPRDGQSVSDQVKELTMLGVGTERIVDREHHCISLNISPKLIDLFYGCCNQEDANDALNRLTPEPSQPSADKLTLSAARFGRIYKHYILCLRDQVILLEDQKKMCDGIANKISPIDTDHSPFFSAPEQLTGFLLEDA